MIEKMIILVSLIKVVCVSYEQKEVDLKLVIEYLLYFIPFAVEIFLSLHR